MGCGTVSVDGDVYLTVLRRSDVRTRTSTTPVRMGLVRIKVVVAWKNRFFPSYGLLHMESNAPEVSEATESYVMKSVFTRTPS